MDSFSFLKYWRRGGSGGDAATIFTKDASDSSSSPTTRTIVTAVTNSSSDSDDGDGGPFFDLEFALPEDDSNVDVEGIEEIIAAPENHEADELKFTLSSSSSVDASDPDFKGQFCPPESSEAEPKFHVSAVLKSATKFGVLMFKFKKSKSNGTENSTKSEVAEDKTHQEKNIHPEQKPPQQHKFFTVKFKVEEVPLVSLFTRDFSSKGEMNKGKNVQVESLDSNQNTSPDRKFNKHVVSKYLKKVKPLYIRVSKRYGEKLGFSGQLSEEVKSQQGKAGSETSAVGEAVEHSNAKSLKQPGLRIVYKQLGKSRSASSADVAAVPAAPAASSRRDDSLLQQQDGIQSAILHCKRSFNASSDLEASIITGSPSQEESVGLPSEGSSSSEKAKGT